MTDPNPLASLKTLEEEALGAISGATDAGEVEAIRIRFLGRKDGRISALLKGLGGLSAEER
ncbi:MAG: hypothetical protein OEZ37_08020, partial [Gemmatimonadota bacterium]|nr:hypothetical protein [Gemmatimonadota bacterium]